MVKLSQRQSIVEMCEVFFFLFFEMVYKTSNNFEVVTQQSQYRVFHQCQILKTNVIESFFDR